MKSLPTLPLLVDAFIADTAHMTAEEVGAHIRLLVFAWRSPGCCLPDDDARLARMLGFTAKRWAVLKPSVMALWQLNLEGNYTHDRLTHEHQFVSANVEKKRAAGRLGGRPKSLELQDQGKASGSAIGKQNESKPKAPTPTPKESPLPPSGGEPDGFAEFRSVYPKRNSVFPTTLARKRWLLARRSGALPSEIIAGAKAYAAEQSQAGNLGTRFVKTADAWLNQGCWKDYAQPPPTASPPPAAVPDETWRDRARLWRARGGHWPWPGSPPDDPRTLVPRPILDELGIGSAREEYPPTRLTGTG